MFTKHGTKLYKKGVGHIVFAINLQDLEKIRLKSHPDCQKEVNDYRVNDIVKQQEELYELDSEYKITGNLVVAAVPKRGSVLNYNYILLDGRHRLLASRKLNHSEEVDFTVEVIRFDDYTQMKKEFIQLNKSVTVPIYKLKNDMEVSEAVDRVTIENPNLVMYSDELKDRITEADIRMDLETADELYSALLDMQEAIDNEASENDTPLVDKLGFHEDTMTVLKEELAKIMVNSPGF